MLCASENKKKVNSCKIETNNLYANNATIANLNVQNNLHIDPDIKVPIINTLSCETLHQRQISACEVSTCHLRSNNANFRKLTVGRLNPIGQELCGVDGNFTVPDGVYYLRITAVGGGGFGGAGGIGGIGYLWPNPVPPGVFPRVCGGGGGGGGSGYAGQVVQEYFNVRPGDVFTCNVGSRENVAYRNTPTIVIRDGVIIMSAAVGTSGSVGGNGSSAIPTNPPDGQTPTGGIGGIGENNGESGADGYSNIPFPPTSTGQPAGGLGGDAPNPAFSNVFGLGRGGIGGRGGNGRCEALTPGIAGEVGLRGTTGFVYFEWGF